MGKQYNKLIKRSRRRKYLVRKRERASAAVGTKAAPKKKAAKKAVKKAAAKKAPAKEAAATEES